MTASELHSTMKLTYVRVLAAEWLKLRTQRGFTWATVTALVVAAMVSALGGALLREEWATDPAGAFDTAVSAPASSIGIAGLIFGLGLCTWLAGEFVSGSNYLSLLVIPKRRLVFSARLGLVSILAVAFGGAAALIGFGSALLFVGAERMAPVVSDAAFWINVVMTLVVSVSLVLLYFAAATLTRRSLPAVGLMAVLFFVMPNIAAAVSFLDGPRALSLILGGFPGSLVTDVLMASSDDANATFGPIAASFLLVSWSVLLVSVSARRFARYE
ncbi:MAG: ABC transporter permease [Coriobacteriia bacterium]|nr:ABC transporter permease [Coriobacteriia bacterium]